MSSPSSDLKPQVVQAGAGAGKTRRLTEQVFTVAKGFQQREGRWPRIVVTTFTRKATQELRERLVLRALKEEPELLEFVTDRQKLRISTIHGVLSLFLSQYAHQLGLAPDFHILEGSDLEHLARQVLRGVAQKRHDPLLETYGFALLSRMLLEYGRAKTAWPDLRVLRLEEYHEAVLPKLAVLPLVAKKIQQVAQAENAPPAWLEFAQAALDVADKPAGRELSIPRRSKKNEVSEELRNLAQKFRESVAELSQPQFEASYWPQMVETAELLADLGSLFMKELKRQKSLSGGWEMNDLELFACEGLRGHPETGEMFSGQWDYWLIDEYQDTSPLQAVLLAQLIGPRPYFVVGDPQQSIYLFRGARTEVFAGKVDEVKRQGGETEFLKTNYRSRPELLAFINQVIRPWPHFMVMEPDPRPRTVDKEGDNPPVSICVAPEDTEAAAVVEHIQKLLGHGVAFEDICILARKNDTLLELAKELERFGLPAHVHVASGFFSRREISDALLLLKFLVHPHDNENVVALLRTPWFRVEDQILAEVCARRPPELWYALCARGGLPAVQRLESYLAGREPSGVSEIFVRALVESGFFDASQFHDATGRREANLWKLVSQLRVAETKPGFNFLNFVRQQKREQAEVADDGDAVSAVEPKRINLMTVHAAKGLQFDHVLLPRLGERLQAPPFNYLLIDEKAKVFHVATLPQQQFVHSFLAEEVRELRKAQEQAESLRLFYVAMTRSRTSLFLSWSGQAAPDSWAKFLAGHGLEVSHGPWHPQLRQKSDNDRINVRPPFAEGPGFAGEKILSVSAALNQGSSCETNVPPQVLVARLKSAEQGSRFHRLFELLRYSNAEQVGEVARTTMGEDADFASAVNYIMSLEEPPMAELLKSGHAEWGFTWRDDGRILQGRMDLWGKASDGRIWVIDYKTGDPRFGSRASAQLRLYAQALRQSGLVPADAPISLAVLYPFHERVEVLH